MMSNMNFKPIIFISIITFFSSCKVGKNAFTVNETQSAPATCSESLSLQGRFQGKNLYVQNPSRDENFCVCSVFINDSIEVDLEYTNSSAFEINMIGLDFKIGSEVNIEINHYGDCTPKVLNPEVY